jgi:hypothetical protein
VRLERLLTAVSFGRRGRAWLLWNRWRERSGRSSGGSQRGYERRRDAGLTVGDVFCRWCPQMLRIPASNFFLLEAFWARGRKGGGGGECWLYIGTGYCQNGRGSWGKRVRNQRRRFQWGSKARGWRGPWRVGPFCQWKKNRRGGYRFGFLNGPRLARLELGYWQVIGPRVGPGGWGLFFPFFFVLKPFLLSVFYFVS